MLPDPQIMLVSYFSSPTMPATIELCNRFRTFAVHKSYAQCHDRVDNIIAVLLQSFDGLLP